MKLAYTLIIGSTLLLIGAFFHQPYWYYMVLRVVLFVTGLTICFFGIMFKCIDLRWGGAFTAFLFNPIFPIDLGREGWLIIDAIFLFVMCSFYVMIKEQYHEQFPNWTERLKLKPPKR